MMYRTLHGIGLSGALFLAASCSVSEAQEGSEDPNQIEEGLTTLVSEDFESSAVGPLGSPWTLSPPETNGAEMIIESTSDHGNVLLQQGGTPYESFVMASLALSPSSAATASFDVNPDPGAAFVWSLHGAGDSIASRRIRLQRTPDSETLVAHTMPGGDISCGTLPSGTWSTVTLAVQMQETGNTFDVLIDGNPTDCTGVETALQAPIDEMQVMDAVNEGWGGDVRFDNIVITGP